MSRIVMAVMTLAILVAMAGCAPQTGQRSDAIAAGADAWLAAFNSGDADAVMALYAEDARLMPPNADIGQGHEAIAAILGELIDANLSIELETLENIAAADVGYRVGTYALSAADGTIVDRGKYVEAWRQVGGEWKIADDIWNSDLPAVPAMTFVSAVHKVKDADTWLAAWQEEGNRREMFAANGAPMVHVMRNPDMANQVGLVVGVTDLDAFMAFLQSPEGAAAKAEDGVIDKGMVLLTEVQ